MADTLGTALATARRRLAEAGVEDGALDARLLVQHFASATQVDLIAFPQRCVDQASAAAIEAAVGRRTAREPLHRILGFRDFYGLRLGLSPATLEPRPDTEILVDAALPYVLEAVEQTGRCAILDLGTGTGAIALALLAQAKAAVAVGLDRSEAALVQARKNAEESGLGGRFTTLGSDWYSEVNERYDVIVANPPYIATGELAGLPPEVRNFDPALALDGGADGLDAFDKIAKGARGHLKPCGRILIEIGYSQREAVSGLFEEAGLRIISVHPDLGGIDRVLCAGADAPL